MSNFICPTCGMTNIDCGETGYKTEREIELEKKLEIAIKALVIYKNLRYDGTVTGYEEFDNITKCYLCAHEKADRLEKENQQLKELLKKCKVAFKIYDNEDETCGLEEENKYAKHLLTKIDNTIGEKK